MSKESVERIQFEGSFSVETTQLINKLKVGKPGDVLDEKALSELVGRDITTKGKSRNLLMTAMKHCERAHRIVWAHIRETTTIKCLADLEIKAQAESQLRRSKRAARRGVQQIMAVDTAKLTQADVPAFIALTQQLVFAENITRASTTKRLVKEAVNSQADVKRLMANW